MPVPFEFPCTSPFSDPTRPDLFPPSRTRCSAAETSARHVPQRGTDVPCGPLRTAKLAATGVPTPPPHRRPHTNHNMSPTPTPAPTASSNSRNRSSRRRRRITLPPMADWNHRCHTPSMEAVVVVGRTRQPPTLLTCLLPSWTMLGCRISRTSVFVGYLLVERAPCP